MQHAVLGDYMKAQGATEYLVLLAVVLIVALVSVALLGFFPGMASDAQLTQSQVYWQSASPIAIVEFRAADHQYTDVAMITAMRLRNTGAYAIRVKKLISEGTWTNTTTNGPSTIEVPMSLYLAPGEEKFLIKYNGGAYDTNSWWLGLYTYAVGSGYRLHYIRAAQPCAPGEIGKEGSILILKDFAFEYDEYVEGQTITKQEIGAQPLMSRCLGEYNIS